MSNSTLPSPRAVSKGSIATGTILTANTNIFSSNLKPSSKPVATFIIYAVLQNAGRLKVIRTLANGTVANAEILNSDVDLVADSAYILTTIVEEDESINLQYDTAATVTKLIVVEDIS